MIIWREKLIAFGLHFFVTLALAAGAAALVFLVWFPDPYAAMLGGSKLFLLISGIDLALGPLTSFVVYDSRKSRRALVFDYTVIGIVQLAAFVYGIVAIAGSRPVYVAFVKDRLEVVTAAQLDDKDLAAATEPYRVRPKWGPKLIGTQSPTDPKELSDLLFSALAGKDLSSYPRYYVPYEANLKEIRERAQPLETLEKRHPEARELLASAQQDLEIPKERLHWLPVAHPRGFWTVLLDASTDLPVRFLPVDPY